MGLFATSGDFVNLALAIGILGISIAMVYFFINAANLIKELRQTLDEVNRQLAAIGEITEAIKNKFTFMFSYWSILEKFITKTVGIVQDNVVSKIKNRFSKTAKKVEDYVDERVFNEDNTEKKTEKKPAKAKAKTGKKTKR
ncbi:MAG TPA: hypothetical protein PKN62_02050 [bacterium]|nr:hypothetical protein [bacterium]